MTTKNTINKQLEDIQNFLAITSGGTETEPFFNKLAGFLAQSIDMDFVCIDRLEDDGLNARTVAVWCDGHFEDNVTYALKDTPCGEVVGKDICCFPASVCQFFPRDQILKDLRAESYVGVTLFNHMGEAIGLIAVISRKPLSNRPQVEAIMKMVGVRAAAELERLDVEIKLRENELVLARSQEIAHFGSWELDLASSRLTLSNESFRIFGLEPKDFVGTYEAFLAVVHPEDLSAVNSAYINSLREGKDSYEVKHRVVRPRTGEVRHVRVKFVYERNSVGKTVCSVGIVQDITETMRAVEELQINEARQRKMVANIGEVIAIIDQQGINRYKSPNIETLFGWKTEEVVGASTWNNIHPEDLRATKEFFNGLMVAHNTKGTMECRYLCKDGSYRFIEFTGVNLLHDPDIRGILGNYHDITDRKKSEDDLRESELRFKALHNASFGGIGIHDKGVILECNQGLSEMTGYSTAELIGMNGLLLISEKSRELVMKNILSGYEKPYEAMGLRKNGEEFPMRLEARNIPYKGKNVRTVEFRDITEHKNTEAERQKLQSQLNQSQKMESVGRLAGGVAHDFNNMLGVILGHVELAQLQIDSDHPLFNSLQEIRKAAERSALLTRQLLTFARKQTVAPEVLDLNETVEGMLKLLRRLIGEDIDLLWLPSKAMVPVRVDPSQIDQLLANLCINARDAISGVGKIIIETDAVFCDDTYCAEHEGAVPGDYVMLAVSDDGCGMDKEILKNLFEPFFTTKGIGKGTGLGLATVYGMVKQNNGFIYVYSEPDQGTTFRIYLPLEASKFALKSMDEETEQAMGGTETILLVEDEPSILGMAKVMLEMLGYNVMAASTPGEALLMAREHAGEIQLLITDVVMPEMNGRTLAEKLLSLYPTLKRLFMSGYTADVIADRGVLNEGVLFIQKPFSMDDLAHKVRQTLRGDKTTKE
ncbi:MAG: PAS domain S-box protein [Desulfobacteraceae bacterium]|jgi:PAS domain S-box-containing protein